MLYACISEMVLPFGVCELLTLLSISMKAAEPNCHYYLFWFGGGLKVANCCVVFLFHMP